MIAEALLANLQCGFWRKQGCMDMIFGARQLMKNTRDHGD